MALYSCLAVPEWRTSAAALQVKGSDGTLLVEDDPAPPVDARSEAAPGPALPNAGSASEESPVERLPPQESDIQVDLERLPSIVETIRAPHLDVLVDAPPTTSVAEPGGSLSRLSPLELPPPPEGRVDVDLKPAPFESTDLRFPINFAAALRLSSARPLLVAAAQAAAWTAEADLQKAQVAWVPAFMMNAIYMRHDGPADFNHALNVPAGTNALGQPDPTSFGRPLNQAFNWFYSGISLYLVVAMTDAVFQPLTARQQLDSARWGIQSAKNDALLMTARAYFDVHKYRGQYAGRLYTVQQGRKFVAALKELSHDLIPAVEVDRGENLLAYLEAQAASAREKWRRSSADLTQVLRLDPRAVVEPLEPDHLQITLIDPSRSLDELTPIGLRCRPELEAQHSLIQLSTIRIRQEKMRPLLPAILLTGFQAPGGMTTQLGIFGTGHDSSLNNWGLREDFSLQAVWQLDSMGLGNLAMIKRQRGAQSEAIVHLFKLQDTVAAEITQAQADMQSAAVRVVEAERTLQSSLATFRGSLEGLGQTRRFGDVLHQIYRPQEVAYALKLLTVAFDEYFATVADYNRAQFEMFHALGYPAQEVTLKRTPGTPVSVDTGRPEFLPAVGTGPPPVPR
ncbi:MAG TPA: hypothetical protein VMF30_07540 [Pirellulales bacterium]|nr:hypothetical protein [Pirellulales bacterium]